MLVRVPLRGRLKGLCAVQFRGNPGRDSEQVGRRGVAGAVRDLQRAAPAPTLLLYDRILAKNSACGVACGLRSGADLSRTPQSDAERALFRGRRRRPRIRGLDDGHSADAGKGGGPTRARCV